MVQALRELMLDVDYDEASLIEALSVFECEQNNESSMDVCDFLRHKAVQAEREGTTRTYLIVNDEQWSKGVLQLDGYFSIALKTLHFSKTDPSVLEEIFGDPKKNNCPAFLIGQLARSQTAPKGVGGFYLEIAMSYIANVSDIIGGRFVYLDCEPEMQSYYEKYGFSFLQNKRGQHYIQMYRIL
ncbi:MAG: hypothetical protein IKV74_06790 [Clostridia bacterium]|nr:hypothetical protein [Clostridia bacterium]